MFCSYFAFLRLSFNVIDSSPLASIVSASSKVALKLIVLNHSWSGNASSSFCFRCEGIQSDRQPCQLPDNLQFPLRWYHASIFYTVCQYVWQTACLRGTNLIYSQSVQVGVAYQNVYIARHIDPDCSQSWFRLCSYLCYTGRCSLCLWHWCERCSGYWRCYGTLYTLSMNIGIPGLILIDTDLRYVLPR